VTAIVRNGVVVLTGAPQVPEDRELIPVAPKLIWDAGGVIDVGNRLGERAQGTGETGLLSAGPQDGQPETG